jgi:hypothetical protein
MSTVGLLVVAQLDLVLEIGAEEQPDDACLQPFPGVAGRGFLVPRGDQPIDLVARERTPRHAKPERRQEAAATFLVRSRLRAALVEPLGAFLGGHGRGLEERLELLPGRDPRVEVGR